MPCSSHSKLETLLTPTRKSTVEGHFKSEIPTLFRTQLKYNSTAPPTGQETCSPVITVNCLSSGFEETIQRCVNGFWKIMTGNIPSFQWHSIDHNKVNNQSSMVKINEAKKVNLENVSQIWSQLYTCPWPINWSNIVKRLLRSMSVLRKQNSHSVLNKAYLYCHKHQVLQVHKQ